MSNKPISAIDCYAHLLPEEWTNWLEYLPPQALEARQWAHAWTRTGITLAEKIPSMGPLVPKAWSKLVEAASASSDFPYLALESTAEDLERERRANRIERVFLVSRKPLTLAEPDAYSWIGYPSDADDPSSPNANHFKSATALRIGRAASRLSRRTDLEWVEWAEDQAKPVYLSTLPPRTWWGRHWEKGTYDLAELEEIVDAHPKVPFILAHSSDDDSLNIWEQRENAFIVTADSSSERLGEVVRRVGAKRVLFGSNWPWGGHKLERSLRAVRLARESGRITGEEEALVLRENAVKLLNINGISV
jgi:hypothetical protein